MAILHEHGTADLSEQKLVQRAFWSVFKAESELLAELPLRSTGIEDYVRNDSVLPTPPDISTEEYETRGAQYTELHSWQEEQSWFFYLAEISLRRTINDMLWLLISKGESYWLSHIDSMEKDYQETERQISAWYAHLPHSIRFDPAGLAGNEFAFYLQGRFFEWKACALRPFLYYVLHRPESNGLSQLTKFHANEHLSVCASAIVNFQRHHRHGGTWFACRRSFTYALCIMGAVIKADPDLLPPFEWRSLISIAIATLVKWESQSADVYAMRDLLERMFQAVCARNIIES